MRRVYQGIRQAIAKHGSFSAKTREAIAWAVGAVNGCAYCQSAHTAAARAAGWSLEDTVAIRAGTADPGPRLAPLLALAREIASSTGNVQDATGEVTGRRGRSRWPPRTRPAAAPRRTAAR